MIERGVKGEVKGLSEVDDGRFCGEVMGKGVGIEGEEGKVVWGV